MYHTIPFTLPYHTRPCLPADSSSATKQHYVSAGAAHHAQLVCENRDQKRDPQPMSLFGLAPADVQRDLSREAFYSPEIIHVETLPYGDATRIE